MGVPLQLILGIVLALVTCSCADPRNLRRIRDAPTVAPTTQNVSSEINNRDLNKIITENPKTESQELKPKSVNNINNHQDFPVKLGSSERNDSSSQKNESEETKNSKEDKTSSSENKLKPIKEKNRDSNARAIDDSPKFWPVDFHSKDDVFTFSPLSPKTTDHLFEGTRHASFDYKSELTTPETKLFDKKFKETVESVEQQLDEIEHSNGDGSFMGEKYDEDNNDDNKYINSAEKLDDLRVIDLINKSPKNASLQLEQTKTIVNNETVNKNSIHKDLDIKQTKRVNFENKYNETETYDDNSDKEKINVVVAPETPVVIITTAAPPEVSSDVSNETQKGTTVTSSKISTDVVHTTEKTVTEILPKSILRKSSLLKESVAEKNNSYLANNKIETESASSGKDIGTTAAAISTTTATSPATAASTIVTDGDRDRESNYSGTPTPINQTPGIETSILPTRLTKSNISYVENLIPLQHKIEKTPQDNFDINSTISSSSSEFLPSVAQSTVTTLSSRLAEDAFVTTTEAIPDTSTILPSRDGSSDSITTVLPNDAATTPIAEIFQSTTETFATTTDVPSLETTTETTFRTSKSLDSMVTEQMLRTSEGIVVETSTKADELSTESTIKNELDSTTLNSGKIVDADKANNTIQKSANNEFDTTTTAEEIISTVLSTTTQNDSLTAVTTNNTSQEKIDVSTEANMNKTDTLDDLETTKSVSSTPDYSFVHIENTVNKQTTLSPEVLSPNLNYSASSSSDDERNKIRKLEVNNGTLTVQDASSSTTPSSISEEPSEYFTTTEQMLTKATENGFTKDSSEGSNKGKIAAIAISCVAAICLVLLAGLLYVMKKRQRRLNYGPRCRPVSLDDYSIDNLSVYNSVRRKGGARMSKRSFGNPAFEDPVAPTHPLNFPALAKFSTNYEDIKAEFDEIPQITAKTSELPEGCDTKNRYANVIPLPETRVFLKLIDGYPNSDYINANYVTGPKNIKGYYIATQGPMQNTVDDFWRMIWEQQVKVMLMLTHLVENGLEKCVDYLPESEVRECSRLFGDFQITLKKREVKEKYIISSLQLKNMVSNSWREVTHFWYLGWPEKGVPNEANSLIAFLIEARSYMKTSTIDKKNGPNGLHNGTNIEHNPVVIHCSPGTGRTGVAIACDIAIREFETTRLVDIPKIVYRIRRDRANAIQTKEQYMFIYKVVSLYATKLTGGALENV